MKKIDLVHITLLIVAILAGYAAIQSIISALSFLTFYHGNGLSDQLAYLSVVCLGPAVICIVLIRNGRRLAELMLKDEPEDSPEQASYWDLDRRNVLFVLFIGIGLYILIQAIPNLLIDFYQLFADKVAAQQFRTHDIDKSTLAIELLRITIGTFLIYASPTLTNFIEQTIAVRLDIKKENKQEE
jgi:hypothetical protein